MHIIMLKSGGSPAVKKPVRCWWIRFSLPIWISTSPCLIANNRIPPDFGLSWMEQMCLRDNDVYPSILCKGVLPPVLLCFSLWASSVPPHPWPASSISVSPWWNAAARPLGVHLWFRDQQVFGGFNWILSFLLAQLSLCPVLGGT